MLKLVPYIIIIINILTVRKALHFILHRENFALNTSIHKHIKKRIQTAFATKPYFEFKILFYASILIRIYLCTVTMIMLLDIISEFEYHMFAFSDNDYSDLFVPMATLL